MSRPVLFPPLLPVAVRVSVQVSSLVRFKGVVKLRD